MMKNFLYILMFLSTQSIGQSNGINYKYYEGTFSAVPSFASFTPIKTGVGSGFDITQANKSTYFAFNFTGYINILTSGQYTFYTNSDDGSNLFVDGALVVNNDGVHAAKEISGIVNLNTGMHTISIGYFQGSGGATLTVSYAGPGILKQLIPGSALYTSSAVPVPVVSDSLYTMIKTLQSQVAFLMQQRSITFDSTQMNVINFPDSLNKKISIKNWITNSGSLALKDSVDIANLKIKIGSLKVNIPSSIISVQ